MGPILLKIYDARVFVPQYFNTGYYKYYTFLSFSLIRTKGVPPFLGLEMQMYWHGVLLKHAQYIYDHCWNR